MLLRSLIQNKLAVAGIHSLVDLQEHYWYLAESTNLSLSEICRIRDYLYGSADVIIKNVSPEVRDVLIRNQLTKDGPILKCAEHEYVLQELTANMLCELRSVCSAKYKYIR